VKTRGTNQAQMMMLPVHAAESATPAVSANSSAIWSVTVLADLEEVSAILRTAIVLAKNFGLVLYVDIAGKVLPPLNCGENQEPQEISRFLESIRSQTRKRALLKNPAGVFILEADMKAASFLSFGDISVRIRPASPSHICPPRELATADHGK